MFKAKVYAMAVSGLVFMFVSSLYVYGGGLAEVSPTFGGHHRRMGFYKKGWRSPQESVNLTPHDSNNPWGMKDEMYDSNSSIEDQVNAAQQEIDALVQEQQNLTAKVEKLDTHIGRLTARKNFVDKFLKSRWGKIPFIRRFLRMYMSHIDRSIARVTARKEKIQKKLDSVNSQLDAYAHRDYTFTKAIPGGKEIISYTLVDNKLVKVSSVSVTRVAFIDDSGNTTVKITTTQKQYKNINGKSVVTSEKSITSMVDSEGNLLNREGVTVNYSYDDKGNLTAAEGSGIFRSTDPHSGIKMEGTITQSFSVENNQAVLKSTVHSGAIFNKGGARIGDTKNKTVFTYQNINGKLLVSEEQSTTKTLLNNTSYRVIIRTKRYERDSEGNITNVTQKATGAMTQTTADGQVLTYKLDDYKATFKQDTNGNWYLAGEQYTWKYQSNGVTSSITYNNNYFGDPVTTDSGADSPYD